MKVGSAALVLAAVAAASSSAARRPPRGYGTGPTTPLQRRLFSELKPRASAASKSATDALLTMLGSKSVTAALEDCCPSVATLPPAELLERVRAEVMVSEVVHNFCATSSPEGRFGERCAPYGDIDLRVGPSPHTTEFYNAWTMQVLNRTLPMKWNNGFMERAEVGLMGYPPFNCTGAGCLPTSVADAKQRPVCKELDSCPGRSNPPSLSHHFRA